MFGVVLNIIYLICVFIEDYVINVDLVICFVFVIGVIMFCLIMEDYVRKMCCGLVIVDIFID